MELHKLNKGDDIWFKYLTLQTHSQQLWKFHYNFNGEPYLKVRVGSELVEIDDKYEIVKV